MNTKSKVLGLMVLSLGIMGDAWAMNRATMRAEAHRVAQERQTTQVAPTSESPMQQQRAVEAFTHKLTTAPPPSSEELKLRGAASQRESRLESSDRGVSGRGSDAMSQERKKREIYIRTEIVPLLENLNNDVQFEYLDLWLNRWFDEHAEIKH